MLKMRSTTSSAILALLQLSSIYSAVSAQTYQEHNLTPDGYYHNQLHGFLCMAAYGNYNTGAFTENATLRNFPNTKRNPWTVYSTFGPTPSGASGYTAIVPLMNKAVIVFRGNYELEQQLSDELVSFDAIGLGAQCPGCMVNAFAAQGYMEAKAATNNFAAIRNQWYGSGLVFSIAGHGLGGMHAQIAGLDFNEQNICYYNHALGSPAVFNGAGATYYNNRFNGEAGERGIYGNDVMVNKFNYNSEYVYAGTAFYYSGWNTTGGGVNWQICWTEDGQYNATICQPHPTGSSSATEDHYYYWTNVGQCSSQMQQTWQEDQFLQSIDVATTTSSSVAVSSSSVVPSSSAVSSASSSSMLSASKSSATLTASAISAAVSAPTTSIFVSIQTPKSAGVAVEVTMLTLFATTLGVAMAFLLGA